MTDAERTIQRLKRRIATLRGAVKGKRDLRRGRERDLERAVDTLRAAEASAQVDRLRALDVLRSIEWAADGVDYTGILSEYRDMFGGLPDAVGRCPACRNLRRFGPYGRLPP